jgi:hypothetical protein
MLFTEMKDEKDSKTVDFFGDGAATASKAVGRPRNGVGRRFESGMDN